VPRPQLVEIVKQLGDRQFAKILQFFLTEVGQITLGNLRIVGPWPWENTPPTVEVRNKILQFHHEQKVGSPCDLKTKLPEGPMPANVKNFKLIQLRFAQSYTYLKLNECKNFKNKNSVLGVVWNRLFVITSEHQSV
jgi:hypothetical protein